MSDLNCGGAMPVTTVMTAAAKRRKEEEAKRDPWEEEKAICEQLILFVEKHLPKKEVRIAWRTLVPRARPRAASA